MSDYMKEMERLLDAHERTLILHERGAAWAEEPMSTRAALLAHAAQRDHTEDVLGMVPPMEHERGRVPDLLDRISAAHDASLDDEHETCRGLLRECLASLILTSTAPSAPAAPAEPVKLPEPEAIERIATTRYRCVPIRLFGYKVVSGDGDRSLFEGTKDECYVVARKLTEAFLDGAHVAFRQMHQYGDAGEAAGYARGRAEKQSKAPEQCRWFQAGPDSDTWQTGCGSYFTINDGTPSENNMAHCAYCGRHLVEYSWEEEQKGGK